VIKVFLLLVALEIIEVYASWDVHSACAAGTKGLKLDMARKYRRY